MSDGPDCHCLYLGGAFPARPSERCLASLWVGLPLSQIPPPPPMYLGSWVWHLFARNSLGSLLLGVRKAGGRRDGIALGGISEHTGLFLWHGSYSLHHSLCFSPFQISWSPPRTRSTPLPGSILPHHHHSQTSFHTNTFTTYLTPSPLYSETPEKLPIFLFVMFQPHIW